MKEELKVSTQKYYECELNRLRNSKIGPDSNKKIKQFLDCLENGRASLQQVILPCHQFKDPTEGMGNSFISPTTNDIIEALAK